MALINRPAYAELMESGTIDVALSPQQVTIGSLLAHVRRGDVVRVHSLRRGAAEAIEAVAHGIQGEGRVIGRKIEDIPLPAGTTIGAVVRGDEVIIAHHDTVDSPRRPRDPVPDRPPPRRSRWKNCSTCRGARAHEPARRAADPRPAADAGQHHHAAAARRVAVLRRRQLAAVLARVLRAARSRRAHLVAGAQAASASCACATASWSSRCSGSWSALPARCRCC